jgi:hypothetical protein
MTTFAFRSTCYVLQGCVWVGARAAFVLLKAVTAMGARSVRARNAVRTVKVDFYYSTSGRRSGNDEKRASVFHLLFVFLKKTMGGGLRKI